MNYLSTLQGFWQTSLQIPNFLFLFVNDESKHFLKLTPKHDHAQCSHKKSHTH